MKVALFHPQIAQNTGNIARSCYLTNTELLLVPPFGFELEEKKLLRAGLDYLKETKITIVQDFFLYLQEASFPFYFFSSKASTLYTKVPYTEDACLIFGSETAGLPPSFHDKWPSHFVTIPMIPKGRCLNLATSVGIGLYEALRQTHFRFETKLSS